MASATLVAKKSLTSRASPTGLLVELLRSGCRLPLTNFREPHHANVREHAF